MVYTHHKPGTPVTQVADTAKKEHCERHYTVGYVPNGGKKPLSPQLKLSGKWLEELGFNTGQSVIVTVERGKLVIEAELRF
ncbi:SymE family type I addiction module toxin [Lonsdalea iberica]|uniref:Toxin SymE-like domain-containing protein n=1 Tax=Lonsdalea iberica TaxID=1082703 RepID=A0A1X3RRR8_9GAMM|nr:SymE family type I addiction module toxin [Lonsdalea iberica]OSN04465.1 hypothetical protein AU511_12555 [Lonsdalea iberica]